MTMREKIARAIQKAEGRVVCMDGDAWDIALSDYEREGYLRLADAVLAALREPTEAMIVEGIIERLDQPTPEAWKLATVHIWQAMLDAASQ